MPAPGHCLSHGGLPTFSHWTPELHAWLAEAAAAVAFDVAGVAPAQGPVDADRFTAWIDAGRAGEMEWLKRRDQHGTLLRSDIQVALPWVRSVIVCAMNYNPDAPRSTDPAAPSAGWIARYAWSGRRAGPEAGAPLVPADYHDDLLARLRTIEQGLAQRTGCETRSFVDTGPLVERGAAARAGVGWVGKNTCILREGLGSWMLLGVIVTALPIADPDAAGSLEPASGSVGIPAADRCGSCTRCLDACPTGALVAPREMDASLCIAYLTIEKKGGIPEPLRAPMGRQVFGCDICQDVCPWNRRAPVAVKPGLETRRELVNPSLEWLASLDSAGFRHFFRGSPLERTGRRRLQRNVAIAMGNSGDQRFIPRLQEWAAGDDPMLAEAAGWALHRLSESTAAQPPAKPESRPVLC